MDTRLEVISGQQGLQWKGLLAWGTGCSSQGLMGGQVSQGDLGVRQEE